MMTGTETDYVLGATRDEQQRLLSQATALEPEAAWLLDHIQVQKGWRVADVGCGPIGILDLLSERVGAEGSVVGIERERGFADMAVARTRDRRNVEIVCADVGAGTVQTDAFDLVHERLVLHMQSDPGAFLARMVSMARPGGWVAVESVDSASYICEPPDTAWHQVWDAILNACRLNGVDAYFGRRLPGLLRAAGLVDIGTRACVTVASPGDYRRELLLALATSLRPLIVGGGLMSDTEIDEHLGAAADHVADPDTLVIGPLHVQAWARKPN